MPLKRKYTVVQSHPQWAQDKLQQIEAESMKRVDDNIVLMDWDEEGCRFNEVGFFTPPSGGTMNVTSVNV